MAKRRPPEIESGPGDMWRLGHGGVFGCETLATVLLGAFTLEVTGTVSL